MLGSNRKRSKYKIMSRNLAVKESLMTEAEYLIFEEKSKIKHEFMDGEVFAMAGGKRYHSLTISNIARHLGNQLEGNLCEVHTSDLRVRIKPTHYVYPDVVIACNLKLVPGIFDTLENPQIIFEVLSKSTAYRDRIEKRMDYFDLESLTDYVIVHQTEMLIEHYERVSQKEWTLRIYDQTSQSVNLNSIQCRLLLDQIYQNIEFPVNLKLVKSKKK